MKTVVHIGMPKAGSTALQTCFEARRGATLMVLQAIALRGQGREILPLARFPRCPG